MTDTSAAAPPRRHGWVRYLLLAVVVLFVAMWVYVLFLAPKTGAYRVRDDAWRTQARQICTEASTRRLALADVDGGYIEHPTREQMNQRADIVDQATAILEQMVDDVAALPLHDENDQLRVDTWVKYYRIIFQDRHQYTATLREGKLEPYRETTIEQGGPVTDVVTDFTSGNDLKACQPPGELGGDTTGTPSTASP